MVYFLKILIFYTLYNIKFNKTIKLYLLRYNFRDYRMEIKNIQNLQIEFLFLLNGKHIYRRIFYEKSLARGRNGF